MSDSLQLVLLLISGLLAGAGLSVANRRLRWGALLASLISAFVLVCGLAWDGPLTGPREHPALLTVGALMALAVLVLISWLFRHHRLAVPLLAVAALPFRIPVDLGGDTANLLIPLYLVIAAATIAALWTAIDERAETVRGLSSRPLDFVLGAAVIVFAAQAIYSDDITAAARTVAFFLAPFAALYAALGQIEWSREALLKCLIVVGVEAVLFAATGIVQAAIGEIFWNPALIASNDFHLYFRANSLFWDPNIYGRYLALAILLVASSLTWVEERRRSLSLSLLRAFVWTGLLFAWSQSSFISLVVGLLVLVALRYRLRWALIAAPIAVVAILAAVVFGASSSDSRGTAAAATSGRTSLVSGGLGLAADRPLAGWGSGSFSRAFAEREGLDPDQTSISHNEIVTIAAEQGLAGLIVYGLVLLTAVWTLFGGLRTVAPGLGGSLPAAAGRATILQTRIALAAGFCLLFAHTMGYAGFLTDPLTWAVLAVAAALGGRIDKRS